MNQIVKILSSGNQTLLDELLFEFNTKASQARFDYLFVEKVQNLLEINEIVDKTFNSKVLNVNPKCPYG
jgi:hypothetical protein